MLRVIAFARPHLIAEQRVHGGVGIDRDGVQLQIGHRPHPLPHALLHGQQLPRDAQIPRGQKTPEGAHCGGNSATHKMPLSIGSRFKKRR